MNYDELKPGLYLQRGTAIKALDVVTDGGGWSWLQALGLDQRVDTDTLADEEAWTATALQKRAQMLLTVPWQWYTGDNPLDEDDPTAAPFEMDMWRLLPQIDRALQTKEHGAFLYKLRGRGGLTNTGRLAKVIWLDPDRMRPDIDTATHRDGVTRFFRRDDKGKEHPIDAKDILWFRRPGMRELMSGASPLEASRLSAEILWNMRNTEDSFFEGNSLPYMLIKVPASTPPAEQERTRDWFYRLFNREKSSREVKTIAVREGVEVQVLSFKPSELDLGATEQRHLDAVLAAHDVPKSIALSNAANYATALSDQLAFAQTMATRLEFIGSVFNNDADFAAASLSIRIDREAMPVMQEEELRRSQGVANLVNAGETLANAYRILGYDLPDDYEEQPDEPEPMPEQQNGFAGGVPPAQAPAEPMAVRSVDLRTEEVDRLRRYVKNGTHVKRAFTSDILTKAEIKQYQAQFIEELIDNEYRDYP